ncbi:MAG: hypothetical protein AAF576_04080 [Pseudomonadota bacterium]
MAAVSLTRAELFAVLLRAARGAGVPLGHAEDLAHAVSDHGDANAITAASRALNQGWAPPLFEQYEGLIFANARAIAALPIALDALQSGLPWVKLLDLDEAALAPAYLDHAAASQAGEFVMEDDMIVPGPRVSKRPKDRPEVSAACWGTLTQHAARTYVPATDTSRQGAGAGSIDND